MSANFRADALGKVGMTVDIGDFAVLRARRKEKVVRVKADHYHDGYGAKVVVEDQRGLEWPVWTEKLRIRTGPVDFALRTAKLWTLVNESRWILDTATDETVRVPTIYDVWLLDEVHGIPGLGELRARYRLVDGAGWMTGDAV